MMDPVEQWMKGWGQTQRGSFDASFSNINNNRRTYHDMIIIISQLLPTLHELRLCMAIFIRLPYIYSQCVCRCTVSWSSFGIITQGRTWLYWLLSVSATMHYGYVWVPHILLSSLNALPWSWNLCLEAAQPRTEVWSCVDQPASLQSSCSQLC